MDIIATNQMLGGSGVLGGTGGGIAIIIGLVFAAVQCFYGYRFFRYFVTIIGFLALGALGYSIGVPISGGETTIALCIAGVLGLIGGFLAFKFYMIGVFLQCFLGGAIIGGIAGYAMQWSRSQTAALAIVAGILLGLAGLKLIKPIVITSTGISGGMQLGVTLTGLVKIAPVFGVIIGAILAICGIAFQIHNLRSPKKEKEDKKTHKPEEKKPDASVEENIAAVPPTLELTEGDAVEDRAEGAMEATETSEREEAADTLGAEIGDAEEKILETDDEDKKVE